MALSLGVHHPETARALGIQLTALVKSMERAGSMRMLSLHETKDVLRQLIAEKRAHYGRVRTVDHHWHKPSEKEARTEHVEAWFYQILSEQGVLRATVSDSDRERMQASGLTEVEIGRVETLMKWHFADKAGDKQPIDGIVVSSLARSGFGEPGEAYRDMLVFRGIDPLPVNRMEVERLDYVARAVALRESAAIRMSPVPDQLALAQNILEETRPADLNDILNPQSAQRHGSLHDVSALAPQPNVKPQPGTAHPLPSVDPQPGRVLSSEIVPAAVPSQNVIQPSSSEVGSSPVGGRVAHEPGVTITGIIKQRLEVRVSRREITEKTQRQIASVCALFVKVVGRDCPTAMRYEHVIAYNDLLTKLPKRYGKSPADFEKSVDELIADGKHLPSAKVGMASGTVNRHLTQLSGIIGELELRGFKLDAEVKWKLLRVQMTDRARDERNPFSNDEVDAIFAAPVWTGCLSPDKRLVSGSLVIHDALYWVPLLAYYEGARREELCGLDVGDVVDDKLGKAIWIRPNKHRKLKNKQSKRRIPLHPELLRVGFLDYVAEIRARGYQLVFPELKIRAPNTPLGETFYNDGRKLIDKVLPNRDAGDKCIHSLRHTFNVLLREADVRSELRGELMGHAGASQTEERYATASTQKKLLAIIKKVRNATKHLSPQPIRLSPLLTRARRRKGHESVLTSVKRGRRMTRP